MSGKAPWAVLFAVSVVVSLSAQTTVSPVVMMVNDQPVYSWEVGLLVPSIQVELVNRGARATREEIVNAAMQRLVASRLLAQEARRRNLEPDGRRVDEAVALMEEQSGGAQGFEAALDNLGATQEQLRANAAESDLVQVFVATQIRPQASVNAEEIKNYYDQNPEKFEWPDMVRARHILTRVEPDSTEEELCFLNGIDPEQRLRPGQRVKIVERSPLPVDERQPPPEGDDEIWGGLPRPGVTRSSEAERSRHH